MRSTPQTHTMPTVYVISIHWHTPLDQACPRAKLFVRGRRLASRGRPMEAQQHGAVALPSTLSTPAALNMGGPGCSLKLAAQSTPLSEKSEAPQSPSPVLTPTAFFQTGAIEFGLGRRGTPAQPLEAAHFTVPLRAAFSLLCPRPLTSAPCVSPSPGLVAGIQRLLHTVRRDGRR